MVKIDTELCIKRLFEGKIVQSRMEPDFVALAYVQKLHMKRLTFIKCYATECGWKSRIWLGISKYDISNGTFYII